MNLILKAPASVPYFTDVHLILRSAAIEIRDRDWYVSDVETNIDVPELSAGSRWFSGDELARVLTTIERLQFIWGVITAVPKGTRTSPVSSSTVNSLQL